MMLLTIISYIIIGYIILGLLVLFVFAPIYDHQVNKNFKWKMTVPIEPITGFSTNDYSYIRNDNNPKKVREILF